MPAIVDGVVVLERAADVFVHGASRVADSLGLSGGFVGLTVVAGATARPAQA